MKESENKIVSAELYLVKITFIDEEVETYSDKQNRELIASLFTA